MRIVYIIGIFWVMFVSCTEPISEQKRQVNNYMPEFEKYNLNVKSVSVVDSILIADLILSIDCIEEDNYLYNLSLSEICARDCFAIDSNSLKEVVIYFRSENIFVDSTKMKRSDLELFNSSVDLALINSYIELVTSLSGNDYCKLKYHLNIIQSVLFQGRNIQWQPSDMDLSIFIRKVILGQGKDPDFMIFVLDETLRLIQADDTVSLKAKLTFSNLLSQLKNYGVPSDKK